MHVISPTIFRAYDIRGIVGQELTADNVFALGVAIGNAAQEQGQKQFIIGRDGRLSSPELANILIDGILESGCDVVDVGMVPTPVLYFATQILGTGTGVMITGSHNPSKYNGFKILINNETLYGDAIYNLYKRIVTNDVHKHAKGNYATQNILEDYLKIVVEKVTMARSLKVVIDCGNGVTGEIAPRLFSALGCEVVPLYCEIDGHFPNHHPDPSVPANLTALIETVRAQQADVGLAFDGDGDRLGVVTEQGEIIWADRLLMLLALDVLKRNPGATIVYDVKCTRLLAELIEAHGGKPLMSPTGHSIIKATMKRVNAPLAGEMSGHIFFKDNWYGFDDGLYSAARLLALLAAVSVPVSTLFSQFRQTINTPEILIMIPEEQKFSVIQALQQSTFPEAEITTIDGLRAEFPKGWGLVRASNTTAALVCRFEAEDIGSLKDIQKQFHEKLTAIAPELVIPF